MAYDPTKEEASEARLDAIAGALTANLAALNTALTRDSYWPASASITSGMIRIGDVHELPSDPQVAPILICVQGSVNDCRIQQDTISGLSYTTGQIYYYETDIYIYLHPEALNVTPYSEWRERVITRVVGWAVSGTLNTFGTAYGRRLLLASQVFNTGGNFDRLVGMVEQIEIDFFNKAYGGTERIRGAHLIHRGYVG